MVKVKEASRYAELRDRILFTVIALIVYRFGSYIPIPGVDPNVVKEYMGQKMSGVLGMFDMFSGGALSRITIFALNISPYILASVMMSLMTSISPRLETLKKEGESGKRQINKYTRYLTLVLATVNGYLFSLMINTFQSNGVKAVFMGMYFPLIAVPCFVGGTLFLMWLGEQINTRGIGNGTSMILAAGILANLPSSAYRAFELGRTGYISTSTILALTAIIVVVLGLVVVVETAQRRIPLQYPKSSASAPGGAGNDHHLPIKVNSAGATPAIFAGSILMAPLTISQFVTGSEEGGGILSFLTAYLNHGHPVYIILYASLVIYFTFFSLSLSFNHTEIADQLRKNGGFIPGLKPGTQSANYIEYVLHRVTVFGSIYLACLCVMPEFLISKFSLPFALSGTSFLIVVSVNLDLVAQFRSYIMSYQYKGLVRKIRVRTDTGRNP